MTRLSGVWLILSFIFRLRRRRLLPRDLRQRGLRLRRQRRLRLRRPGTQRRPRDELLVLLFVLVRVPGRQKPQRLLQPEQ